MKKTYLLKTLLISIIGTYIEFYELSQFYKKHIKKFSKIQLTIKKELIGSHTGGYGLTGKIIT